MSINPLGAASPARADIRARPGLRVARGLPAWAAGEIYAPILASDPARPFVVAQLGQSLDGRIATVTGESRYISGADALDHLHRLRALVDAVVVGAGTIVADDPRLTVRRVTGRDPCRAVIDAAGRTSRDARWLAGDGAARVVFTDVGGWPAGVEQHALPLGPRGVDPHAIVAALVARGCRRVLVEGGADTISRFMDAGAVDRLHVCVAPVILGSGRAGLTLAASGALKHARRPLTRAFPLGGGEVLFDCDLRGEA